MQAFGLDNSYSSLYPKLADGGSPDDSFSEVPYEKGYQHLLYVEGLFKKKEDFQDLIKKYIKKFS